MFTFNGALTTIKIGSSSRVHAFIAEFKICVINLREKIRDILYSGTTQNTVEIDVIVNHHQHDDICCFDHRNILWHVSFTSLL